MLESEPKRPPIVIRYFPDGGHTKFFPGGQGCLTGGEGSNWRDSSLGISFGNEKRMLFWAISLELSGGKCRAAQQVSQP